MSVKENKFTIFISIILVFLISMVIHFIAYSQTPYANGWDNYFYLIQIKSYVEKGVMHSSRISLFYPFLLSIYYFIHDYVLSIKIAACLLVSFFTVMMFLLAYQLSSGQLLPALLMGSYCLFSPQLTYYGAQFTHNLMGACLFLILLYWIFSRKRWLAALSLLATLLAHKLTAGISLLFVWLEIIYLRISKTNIKKNPRIFISTFLIIICCGFLFDSILLRDQHLLSPIPSLPILSFFQTHGEILNAWWVGDLIISTLLFIACSFYLVINKSARNIHLVAYIICLCLLCFPFFRWSINGFAYRFFMLFAILAPLLVVPFVKFLNRSIVISLIFFLTASSFWSYTSYTPSIQDPSYDLYHRVSVAIEKNKSSIPCELIIGHKCLAEYVCFETGLDVMPWIPDYKINQENLWRITYGINEKTARFYAGEENAAYIFNLIPHYLLIREDIWQMILTNMREDDHALYEELMNDWRNPKEIRPSFLSQH
jgi:hypothetical protein